MKVFILYDCPNETNDKKWLAEEIDRKFDTTIIEPCGSMYHIMRERYGKIKVLICALRQCITTLFLSKSGDVIVCWGGLTANLFNLLSMCIGNKRNIISMNWLSPPVSKKMKILLKKTIKNPKCKVCVNCKSSIDKWILYLNAGIRDRFIFLPDVYDITQFFESPTVEHRNGTCFTGGMNNRDWEKLMCIARKLKNIKFVCVALKGDWEKQIQEIPDNVEVYFSLPVSEYYEKMRKATLILLPLKEDKSSGLINIIRSAQYGKICCVSDYEVTRQYYGKKSREFCLGKEIENWVKIIRNIYKMTNEEYDKRAKEFQEYIQYNFAPTSAGKIMRNEIDNIIDKNRKRKNKRMNINS